MKKILLLFVFGVCYILITSNSCLSSEYISPKINNIDIYPIIEIDSFSINCSLKSNVSVLIHSTDSLDFFLFLPSSRGPSLIEKQTISHDSDYFEYKYYEPEFEGKLYHYGTDFPLDRYELFLMLVIKADVSANIVRINEPKVIFSNRINYADWVLKPINRKVDSSQALIDKYHIADPFELESVIDTFDPENIVGIPFYRMFFSFNVIFFPI